ncbi:hypothetical protein SAMN05444171_7487 [Bradyrhizobium lablabi]|uniref:Uncharacterized protein n=2 Tax=Bradyrhizobium TaxID=374 RepID=A0ABY0QG95_9BRAD|nr:hypothetical protein SAMN05444163_7644 [Bradyrhizobium ottawaense]SEE43928.1 hypothetical protein SAMN05444171_7487 [Bradyrhizobium lablabi]SHM43088.1 hypothetical protein SAMN05444321_6317 [Bradyrhizobium lablabi]
MRSLKIFDHFDSISARETMHNCDCRRFMNGARAEAYVDLKPS